jgi:hypothetical protein
VGSDTILARLDGRVEERDWVTEGGVVYVGVVGCVLVCDRGAHD